VREREMTVESSKECVIRGGSELKSEREADGKGDAVRFKATQFLLEGIDERRGRGAENLCRVVGEGEDNRGSELFEAEEEVLMA
jgi:hypothetical protein